MMPPERCRCDLLRTPLSGSSQKAPSLALVLISSSTMPDEEGSEEKVSSISPANRAFICPQCTLRPSIRLLAKALRTHPRRSHGTLEAYSGVVGPGGHSLWTSPRNGCPGTWHMVAR